MKDNENPLERPNYYGVITARVRYDPDTTPNAKLLYAEITALVNMRGVCWATNKYFAELYGVLPNRISVWVKQLESKGFIRTKTIKGGYRGIYLSDDPYAKAEPPLTQKQNHNNTVTNNNSYVDLKSQLLAIVNKVTGRSFRTLPERGVKKTLDSFSLVEIESALAALAADDWHAPKLKELSIDYFIRSTTIDKFLGIAEKQNTTVTSGGKVWTPEMKAQFLREQEQEAEEFRTKTGKWAPGNGTN